MFHNVELLPYKKNSPWRKVAVGTWRKLGDPSVYGEMYFDARPCLRVIEEHRLRNIKITPIIIAAKAIAVALDKVPSANVLQRFGRVYRRKNVDIFLQVATDDDGEDLSGLVIRNCHKRPLDEIAEEVRKKVVEIRTGEEKEYSKSKGIMELLPGWFVGPLLDTLAFILYNLNFWSPLIGAPRDGFGSAMVTSIGSLGLERAYAPLVPYSRCPMVIAVGKIGDQVVAENGAPVVRPMIPFSSTIDHRVIDGVGIKRLVASVQEYLKNPY